MTYSAPATSGTLLTPQEVQFMLNGGGPRPVKGTGPTLAIPLGAGSWTVDAFSTQASGYCELSGSANVEPQLVNDGVDLKGLVLAKSGGGQLQISCTGYPTGDSREFVSVMPTDLKTTT
jgi:hypothetical protein